MAALREIASWIGQREDLELVLQVTGRGLDEAARYRGAAVGLGKVCVQAIVTVRGRPDWQLLAGRATEAPPDLEEIENAATALEAWRASRVEMARAEARLASRTRELDLIQELGRRAAEAQTPHALFSTAASLLHEKAGIDLVVVLHRIAGPLQAHALLACDVGEEDLTRLVRSAQEALGGPEDPPPPVDVEILDGCDRGGRKARAFLGGQAVTLPLLRHGRPIAVMAIVPTDAASERILRTLYSAANQLSLHLERVLSVRESEQGRFRSILDSMPQAVFLTDTSRRVILSNLSAERLMPRLQTEGMGHVLERIGELELGPLALPIIEGRSASTGGEARLSDRTSLSVTLSAVGGAAGKPESLVVVLADVSEARRLHEHLAQSEKMSSLGRITAGIAHELNNPLASVLGYSQLVRSMTSEEKLLKRLEIVYHEAQRCQRIVQNILRFARPSDPERKPLSLNEIVESVLSLMAYQLRVDGIQVVIEADRDLPRIHGDAHQLRQALLNLIANSHHALRDAGRRGAITVSTGTVGHDRVFLEIRDDGPGIPDPIRARIFDPFFTTKASGKGTGLGLSLVYGTVIAHGGSIHVDSGEGCGTTFRIDLPVGTPSPTPSPPVEPALDAGTSVSGHILVVDDEEAVASLICEALSADGHRAEPASDGREALIRLAEERFDLVITDLRTPGLRAELLHEQLERLQPGFSRRILLTTGDIVSREPDALAESMGVEVIQKPFDLDDLRRIVNLRLRAHRER